MAASWGLFWGGWAALIPELKADLGLTDQQLGLALFAVPVAAVPAMVLTGRLARRLAQRTLPAVTAVFALSTVLVGLAPSALAFTAALLLVGGASGAIEVALNATTAAQEARAGERLFNKVHAATPLAMVIAAPSVGLAREFGASTLLVLSVIAMLVALSAVLAIDPRGWREQGAQRAAQQRIGEQRAGEQRIGEPEGVRVRRFSRLLLLLGALGATVLLLENAVEQWSAIHLEQQLGAGPFLASLAPATYMAGLAVGRMLAQWRGGRLGDRTLMMVGGVLGCAGLAIGALAGNPLWALFGFAISGLGLAPVIPTLLSAAGHAVGPQRRSTAIATVTTVGYAGFLSSPPLVGTLSGWLSLPTALGILSLCGILVIMVVGALLVRVLPARTDKETPARPSPVRWREGEHE